MMSSVAGRRRPYWKGVTTTLCVDISESMATVETWGQVREFVGSFLQGENGWDVDGTELLSGVFVVVFSSPEHEVLSELL